MPIPPVESLLDYEQGLWRLGFKYIAGIDEAGRGPLAGPVVSACVIFPPDCLIEGVYDSKALTPSQRMELYWKIIDRCICYSIFEVDNQTIDRVNILEATKLSMIGALEGLKTNPDFVIIDAVNLPIQYLSRSIIQGDKKSFTIAAASILAKVYRDNLMNKLHEEFPSYHWNKNKGYGTIEHRKAILKHGFSPYHRKSFTVRLPA